MTVQRQTVHDRIATWYTAYQAVSDELTPKPMRAVLDAVKAADGAEHVLAVLDLARIVSANDRTAATVAAMLVPGVHIMRPEEPILE